MASQYLVVIEVCGPRGPRPRVQKQLTYKVTHLRPGQNEWALVSQVDCPAPRRGQAKAPAAVSK